MYRLLKPGSFIAFSEKSFWPITAITALAFIFGLYDGLVLSPVDYQQSDAVRMMYVHVPAAWMALFVYVFVALNGAALLIWRGPLSSLLGIAAAPIGMVFTAICLITGSIWGKPIWGSWWVWDARLTSVLILFFIYMGYLAIYRGHEDGERGAYMAAIFSLFGLINIPIIKFSVEWWSTLHQPASILRKGGIAIAPEMLRPLVIMFVAYVGFFLITLIIRLKKEQLMRKNNALRHRRR